MEENDNIEELFRSRANDLDEKPSDLVWSKIESNLQTKQKKPIQEFVQSVWFSAAVFALIAIPYFVIFTIKQQEENMDLPTLVSSDIEFKMEENSSILESSEDEIQPNATEEKIESSSKIEEKPIKKSTKEIVVARNDVKKAEKEKNIDEVKTNEPVTLAASAPKEEDLQRAETTMKLSRAKVSENQDVVFLEDQFLILDSIYKVNFKLKEKSKNQLVFENKEIQLEFDLKNDSIHVKSTNELNPTILKKIKTYKKDIFKKYKE